MFCAAQRHYPTWVPESGTQGMSPVRAMWTLSPVWAVWTRSPVRAVWTLLLWCGLCGLCPVRAVWTLSPVRAVWTLSRAGCVDSPAVLRLWLLAAAASGWVISLPVVSHAQPSCKDKQGSQQCIPSDTNKLERNFKNGTCQQGISKVMPLTSVSGPRGNPKLFLPPLQLFQD